MLVLSKTPEVLTIFSPQYMIWVSDVQPLNAPSPIEVIDDGSVTFTNEAHDLKQLVLMAVRFGGN